MKKLNIVLHETTIINFPFFWKLVLRYKLVGIIVPTVCILFSAHYYFDQNNLFQRSIHFKNVSAESESASSAIASVIGEKTNGLNPTEVIGMTKSLDFQQEFAEKVYSHKSFQQLNLKSINQKGVFSMDVFLASCSGERECIYKKIRGRISGMIKIKEDRTVTNRYLLEALSRDTLTTRVLLEEAAEMIVGVRIRTIRHKIQEQIKISKELSAEKRDELEKVNLSTLKENKKKLESELNDLNFKIQSYSAFLSRLTMDLDFMETQLKETKRVAKSGIKSSKIITFQKRKRLEDKVKRLESDIGAIKIVADRLSEQDEVILKQLKRDLTNTQVELKSMGNKGRGVSSEEKFLTKKEGEESFTEFDFKVKKEQLVKTQREMDSTQANKNIVLDKLSVLDASLEKIKPSFEYLKLLEQKVIQLNLLNSTVVGDLVFENEFGAEKVYKKVSRSKVILFSIGLILFFLVAIILTLYLLDDRIYDQFELEKSFDDLTIIGNTPDFD